MTIAFGTSGLRGLATDLTDEICIRFARAFIEYFETVAKSPATQQSPRQCIVAGDLRESTPRILAAISQGLRLNGFEVLDAGLVPTPALAYECVTRALPGIMVTGSHIPGDRNGIKFYLPWGEILKTDEAEITRREKEMAPLSVSVTAVDNHQKIAADSKYISRYVDYFGPDALSGFKIVFFEHSSIAREVAPEILESLGAKVVRVGRSETFVSVDTEALENVKALSDYVKQHQADALVSTDGDGDRPLFLDESGAVVRGDQIGILASHALMADSVSTPVSTTTALDMTGWFSNIRRCKIGSPFVVDEMEKAKALGFKRVVGFEANGGFLLGSEIPGNAGASLKPLATRDSILPVLLCLAQAKNTQVTLSQLVATLPSRFTGSDLIRNVPSEKGQQIIRKLQSGGVEMLEKKWISELGKVRTIDQTDGYRITFDKGDILHFRVSGNAPEFRVYSESDTETSAVELNRQAKEWIQSLGAKGD